MKKIYQQWQLVVRYMTQDAITTSGGEVQATGYAWKRTEWNSVDDNPWN